MDTQKRTLIEKFSTKPQWWQTKGFKIVTVAQLEMLRKRDVQFENVSFAGVDDIGKPQFLILIVENTI